MDGSKDSIVAFGGLQNIYQYIEDVFKKFEGLSCFPRKMVLYSLTKFGIISPWIFIPWRRRFDLGFWKTSKQIYRNVNYREKVFGDFQGLSCFPRKMVLFSSTNFCIIKPWTKYSIAQKVRFRLSTDFKTNL